MIDIKNSWKQKGYVDEPISGNICLEKEIRRMCEEKNAIILSHYYTDKSLQQIADFVGDSLALARQAQKTKADIIVMVGVHFMGETNKILCPDKKVLIPDMNSSCSLAESCPADQFSEFKKKYPDHKVVSYVNTSAAIKALTDITVTSANACEIIESLPKDEKIIFGPDRNLGAYINAKTGRNMLLWDGACSVHERFSVEKIIELKKQHPKAKVLAHPECKGPILKLADIIGSTAALLKYTIKSNCEEFIIATESGIIFEMERNSPGKTFIPVPPETTESVGCHCNECAFMRLNTMEKLYNCLKYEWPEIIIDKTTIKAAIKPINKMLRISEELGL